MLHQYAIEQGPTQINEILAEVQQGNPIEIVRDGQRVAVLVPGQDYDVLTDAKPDFWTAIEAYRQTFNIAETGVDDQHWPNLRDPSPGRDIDL